MVKVLIVDDDLMVADCLEEILAEAGYDVCGIAATGADAIKLNERHRADLSVIDVRLANGEFGTDVAARLRGQGPIGVLYATGNPNFLRMHGAVGEGFISKPYTAKGVVAALQAVGDRIANAPPAATLPAGFTPLGG